VYWMFDGAMERWGMGREEKGELVE